MYIIKNLIEVSPSGDLQIIGDTDKTGTITHFTPDTEIFTETIEFEYDILCNSNS